MYTQYSLIHIEDAFLLDVIREAGREILTVYEQAFTVSYKDDYSPLTEADLRANQVITSRLQRQYPDIPILSEESRQISYEERQYWQHLWLVDPLDGTKEFIKRNGEFTVNIALVESGRPVLGMIYHPVADVAYYARLGQGAYRQQGQQPPQRLKARPVPAAGAITVIGSRSHHSEAMTHYLADLEQHYHSIQFISAGSALKFCRVAEGLADVYPRLAPTMEWDTAAGQIIVEESGKTVCLYESGQALTYNREDLVNPWFICR